MSIYSARSPPPVRSARDKMRSSDHVRAGPSAEVSQTFKEPPRPATRGYPRAQQLQPPWSGSSRLVEEAPACGVQSRARDRIASVVGRREVCGRRTERAGGCASEKNAPLPPRRERSRSVRRR